MPGHPKSQRYMNEHLFCQNGIQKGGGLVCEAESLHTICCKVPPPPRLHVTLKTKVCNSPHQGLMKPLFHRLQCSEVKIKVKLLNTWKKLTRNPVPYVLVCYRGICLPLNIINLIYPVQQVQQLISFDLFPLLYLYPPSADLGCKAQEMLSFFLQQLS